MMMTTMIRSEPDDDIINTDSEHTYNEDDDVIMITMIYCDNDDNQKNSVDKYTINQYTSRQHYIYIVIIGEILTISSILTWIRVALIGSVGTCFTKETLETRALEVVDQICTVP